jgi:hypothetical protein
VPPSHGRHEYPTPEVDESEELEPREEEKDHDEAEGLKADDSRSTLAAYGRADDQLRKQALLHMDPKSAQPDSTLPKI